MGEFTKERERHKGLVESLRNRLRTIGENSNAERNSNKKSGAFEPDAVNFANFDMADLPNEDLELFIETTRFIQSFANKNDKSKITKSDIERGKELHQKISLRRRGIRNNSLDDSDPLQKLTGIELFRLEFFNWLWTRLGTVLEWLNFLEDEVTDEDFAQIQGFVKKTLDRLNQLNIIV